MAVNNNPTGYPSKTDIFNAGVFYIFEVDLSSLNWFETNSGRPFFIEHMLDVFSKESLVCFPKENQVLVTILLIRNGTISIDIDISQRKHIEDFRTSPQEWKGK